MSTITERHALAAYHRARLRRWRPTLAELFNTGQAAGKQPSATKRGPGRRHKQGYPGAKRRRRIEWSLRDLVRKSEGPA